LAHFVFPPLSVDDVYYLSKQRSHFSPLNRSAVLQNRQRYF
jgi:hypothetical protein